MSRMTKLVALLFVLPGLLFLRPTARAEATASKLAVARIELGYTLEGGRMRARVTLGSSTGEAMDFDVKDAAAMDVVLKMAAARASGARLFAEVEDRQVKALILSAP